MCWSSVTECFRCRPATLASNADPIELAAWLDGMRQGPDIFKWPLNVIVVRSGGRTVLVDAGIGTRLPSRFPQAAGLLAERLEAAGIDPASITDVVLSHLHMDHVGGLLADGLKGQLHPDVPIHVAAAEIDYWASPDFSRNTFGGMQESLRSAAGIWWTGTATSCGPSTRSMKWHRACSSRAQAATRRDTVWSA